MGTSWGSGQDLDDEYIELLEAKARRARRRPDRFRDDWLLPAVLVLLVLAALMLACGMIPGIPVPAI